MINTFTLKIQISSAQTQISFIYLILVSTGLFHSYLPEYLYLFLYLLISIVVFFSMSQRNLLSFLIFISAMISSRGSFLPPLTEIFSVDNRVYISKYFFFACLFCFSFCTQNCFILNQCNIPFTC